MASHESLPVVLCGRLEKVGSLIIEELKPEYEVIHFITSIEDGVHNLPPILSGSLPLSDESGLGSKSYSRPPKAVILGGGYDDEAIARLRYAVTSFQGAIEVPWLKADLKKTEAGPTPGTDEYCNFAASRMKETLRALQEREKLDRIGDGIFLW